MGVRLLLRSDAFGENFWRNEVYKYGEARRAWRARGCLEQCGILRFIGSCVMAPEVDVEDDILLRQNMLKSLDSPWLSLR